MARAEGGCSMRRTPRFLIVALPVVLVAAALWIRPASVTTPPPTIEPTLPLTLELRALPERPGRSGPQHLEATLNASGDLQDISLSLVLPEGLDGDRGALPGDRTFRLRGGEKRVYIVPVQARRAGIFPVKIEASFRLPDGRVLHTQQGMLWRSGAPAPEGRHNAGAYEWMGVQVGEPQP